MQEKKLFGLSSVTLLIIICAAAKFAVHMLTAQNYGYFCDELYTIAMSKHLAFGYVDLPPLAPALCALSRLMFGESLLGVHIFPALAGSAMLVFVCLITKELGGKRFSIGISALGFIIAPVWLSMDSFFAYDSIDQLVLTIFLYMLVKLIKTGNKKLWLPIGLIAGIAFMTKATIVFLGPGFVAALIILKYRKHLLTRWPWIGMGIFLLVISPYIIWQHLNNWPTIEYWTAYGSSRVFNATLPEYLLNIVILLNPALFPIIAAGLYRIFKPFDNKNYSFLGIMFLITLIVMFVLKAKTYMLAELFIPLIAAGSIFIEEKVLSSSRLKWLKNAAVTTLLIGGAFAAPLALPLLPPDLLIAYTNVFGIINKSVKLDNLPKTNLPQTTADRFGWDNLVKTVAEVYEGLSPEEKKDCGILTDWFGPAGAIDLLGQQYGLPHAVSGHLTYYLWGPGENSWDVMIVVTNNYNIVSSFFGEATLKAIVKSDYAMPYNTNLPVYICRKPTMPVDKIWEYLKGYN